jgi:hypothetical protein
MARPKATERVVTSGTAAAAGTMGVYTSRAAAPGRRFSASSRKGGTRSSALLQLGSLRASTILPKVSSRSSAACARATSAMGRTRSITGRIRPAARSGSRVRAASWVRAIFSSMGRERSTVPTRVRRRDRSRERSISARAPARRPTSDEPALGASASSRWRSPGLPPGRGPARPRTLPPARGRRPEDRGGGIERVRHAVLVEAGALPGGAGQAEHAGAGGGGHLRGRRSHAGSGGGEQDGLPRAQASPQNSAS